MSLAEQRAEPRQDAVRVGNGPSRSALFAVDVRTIPGEIVLSLRGELDIATQPLLARALAEVDGSDARIVLDLSDLTFIDCANIGLIHDARVLAGMRGTFLELRSPRPDIQRVLELTGLVPTASADRIQHRMVLPLPSRAPRVRT